MKVTVEDILNIRQETQTLEFKRLRGPKVVRKIIQTIVAMANTEGGVIVLGVQDPQKNTHKGLERVFGIEEDSTLYDHIFHEIKKITPPCPALEETKVPADNGKHIVLLSVPKSTESFLSFDNNVWIRLEQSNKKLTLQEIAKLDYAKGFKQAEKELVDIDVALLQTEYFEAWREERGIPKGSIEDILLNTGLAKKGKNNMLKPRRAAVLLFARYPTDLLETHCAVRVIKLKGTVEQFNDVPNYLGVPETIDGPIIEVIRKSHKYVLDLLRSGIAIHSGFTSTFRIPQRAVQEAITNAVIHRDYYIKRDIEIRLFEDRIEILSPGLFPYNITSSNIGTVRADGARNDLLVKHLRQFPDPPNLDLNEGVRAMRGEMMGKNLYPPLFLTYPLYDDSVKVILFNEERPSQWEKVKRYLEENTYINNKTARQITNVEQSYTMSRMLKKWTKKKLLVKIDPGSDNRRGTVYKLAGVDELKDRLVAPGPSPGRRPSGPRHEPRT